MNENTPAMGPDLDAPMTKTGIDVFLTCVASVLHYLARHAKTEPDDVRHQL